MRKRIQQIGRRILVLAALVGFVRPALAEQASSSFDNGFDGWTPVFFGFSWESSGGNPDGFIQFTECCIPPYSSMVAPQSYLGDWSSLDGIGAFRYDFRLFGGTIDPATAGVLVDGPGGSMFWHQRADAGVNGWETLIAPLNQSSWDVTSGNWNDILANVTEVRLAPDSFGGTGEVTGVDNIALVPEPSPAVLVAGVAVILAGFRWCFRRRRRASERAA